MGRRIRLLFHFGRSVREDYSICRLGYACIGSGEVQVAVASGGPSGNCIWLPHRSHKARSTQVHYDN